MVRASLVPAAIGVDHTLKRYDAYRMVAYGDEKPVSAYLQSLFDFGTKMEPKAIAHVELAINNLVFYTGDRQRKFVRDRYSCHTDGLIDRQGICEVKSRKPDCPAYEVGDKHWQKHMAQVQQMLWITGRLWCIFCCYCVEGESKIWKVYRTAQYIAAMHEHLAEFCEFVDGKKACPPKIKKRPVMPDVMYEDIQ